MIHEFNIFCNVDKIYFLKVTSIPNGKCDEREYCLKHIFLWYVKKLECIKYVRTIKMLMNGIDNFSIYSPLIQKSRKKKGSDGSQ